MREISDESKYIASGPIYRFVDIEGAKKTLENQTLKFTNPEDFNDPFDCNRAILKFTRTKNDIDDYIQALKLEKRNSKRSDRRKLLNAFKNDPKEFKRAMNHVISKKIASSAVCCFSKQYDNTLMWSHYADKHRGVCFECNSSLDRTEILENGGVGLIGNVDYSSDDKFRINYNTDKRLAIINLYLRKSIDWKYEEEVRIVLLNEGGIQKFKKQFLTGVIFGCKIDKNEKKELLKIIDEKGYEVTIKEAKKGDFKLEYDTIR
jgi:hypothetical protein